MSDENSSNEYVFTLKCPDRLGVMARISGLLYGQGAFITEVSQHSDPYTNTFFSRLVFDDRVLQEGIASLSSKIDDLAKEFEMAFRFRETS